MSQNNNNQQGNMEQMAALMIALQKAALDAGVVPNIDLIMPGATKNVYYGPVHHYGNKKPSTTDTTTTTRSAKKDKKTDSRVIESRKTATTPEKQTAKAGQRRRMPKKEQSNPTEKVGNVQVSKPEVKNDNAPSPKTSANPSNGFSRNDLGSL